MTRPARVEARGWGWRHAGRNRWAVGDLDLRIEPGERVLLLGASGSGKSTVLRGLAGVLGDEEDGEGAGELLLDGSAPAGARGRAGLVLQDPDAQVILARVGDDVAFGCENLGIPRDEIWRRVPEALRAVGLHLPLDHPTSALSGGEKQRLALAGALAMRPGLLLLDEPTANLDPAGVVEVRDAVIEATRGSTLIVVEHRVDVWTPHVDRVIVLGAADAPEGAVLADGPPDRVFRAHEAALTAAGVWVPGVVPSLPRSGGGDRRPPAVGSADSGRARRDDSGRAADASEPLLEARDLAVGRRSFGERTPRIAASGLRASVESGRALAITGPNGVGKSTLALTLAGMLEPASGILTSTPPLTGDAASATPRAWSSRELLTRIGLVFQDPEHQLLTSTVRAELEVGPHALRLDPDEIAARVDPLLERLGLGHLAAVNPFTLSGGEKRRLTVAAALATRPAVLVLDEPTYGQDARTWRELAALIDEVRAAGTAIVFVSHDRNLVDVLADDVLEIGADI